MLLTARNLVIALAIAAVILSGLIARDVYLPAGTAPVASRTAVAQRGTVRVQVSGTGNVVPASQVGVAFKVPGVLTEIDVHVGDHVSQGQVLARVDTTSLQAAVDSATAGLATAQANLDAAQSPLAPGQLTQLYHALATAQTSYSDTVNTVNATNSADQSALNSDQAAYNSDNATYQSDQAALNSSPSYQFDRHQQSADQAQLQTDVAKYNSDGCQNPSPPPVCTADGTAVQNDQARVASDNNKVAQDQATVNADAARVAADQARINSDNAKLTTDQANGQKSINAARAAITAAQDAINTQTIAKPSAVAAAQAAVMTAQTALGTAQANLANAVLTAPSAGVINSINGQVGEAVTTATGVTAEAPGTSAPQPNSSGATTASASTFMVMASDSAFVVVAPFPEPDAAKLSAGLPAVFTFDALAGIAVPGQVLAVAAASTTISSVVSYYVSFSLTRIDPRIRAGMTANAVVTVQAKPGVVAVSNQALHRAAGRTTVTRIRSDGSQEIVPVVTGIAGDSTTEIVSGLSAGDKVALPQLRTTTTTRVPGGAGPGGGGGFLGGGGRGG